LMIGDTSPANVLLVDWHWNFPAYRPGTDYRAAVYANNCIFGAGSTLDLNGYNLYCDNITDNGTTILYNGGQLIQATTGTLPARIAGQSPEYYSTVQAAIDNAWDGEIVESQSTVFNADLFMDMFKSITLKSGFDSSYLNISGATIINGNITVKYGSLILADGNLIIQ
jgi:hypothetical protein